MEWIQMMSGIGACASAVAAWLAVREMRKQADFSHMPQVACSLSAVASTEEQSFITLVNVGLGSALNLDVAMSMPFDFLDALNNALKSEDVHVGVEDGQFRIENVLSDGGTSCHSISIPSRAHIQFILPGKEARLRMPDYLSALTSLMAEKRLPENREAFRAILARLHLDIAVDFSDIGDKRRSFRQRYAIFDADYVHDQKRLTLRFA